MDKKENYTMNKTDLISGIAERSGLTKKDSEKALEAFITTVQEGLIAGNKISLAGFGTFEVKQRAARKGVNPQTKKPITIEATKAPSFKISKTLKDMVAGK
ncbi:MAG: HU family DNA-binding protein [Bacillota bacterium]|nr:HU family DNA-binding protein [Bacillota bacterium]